MPIYGLSHRRQGNENTEIEILSYVVEGSFDAVMWATVARKQQGISSFMRGAVTEREMTEEDGEVLSYEQIAAAASGDEDYLRKAELDQRVFKLQMMKQAHDADITNRRQAIPRIEGAIIGNKLAAESYDDRAEFAKGVRQREVEFVSSDGKRYTDKAEAAKALTLEIATYEKRNKEEKKSDLRQEYYVGTYKGMRVYVDIWGNPKTVIPPTGRSRESHGFWFNPNYENYAGTLQSFDQQLASIEANKEAKRLREVEIPSLDQDLANLRKLGETPFPYQEELTKAKTQLDQVSKRLAAKEKDRADAGEPLVAASGLEVRLVGQLGRRLRRVLREKQIKPSEIPGILEQELAQIKTESEILKREWREYVRRKTEAYLDHYGLEEAAMWELAKSTSCAQRAFGDLYAEQQEQTVAEAPADIGAQITERMAGLQRSPGAPVLVGQLRAKFSGLGKEEFDAAMLRLAEEGRIALHRHDYPSSLSEDERNKLIKVGDEYFIAATVREAAAQEFASLQADRGSISAGDVASPAEHFYHSQMIVKERGKRSDREAIARKFKQTSREERFHWSQRQVAGGQGFAQVGASWAQSTKGWGKYRRALMALGYPDNPEILAAEIAAHIAAEKYGDLSIKTEAEIAAAEEWLARYFERVAERYGIGALDKFGSLLQHAGRARKKAVTNVYTRQTAQGVGGAQAGQAGATGNRPPPAGGGGRRVQGGGPGGQRRPGQGPSGFRQTSALPPALPPEAIDWPIDAGPMPEWQRGLGEIKSPASSPDESIDAVPMPDQQRGLGRIKSPASSPDDPIDAGAMPERQPGLGSIKSPQFSPNDPFNAGEMPEEQQ